MIEYIIGPLALIWVVSIGPIKYGKYFNFSKDVFIYYFKVHFWWFNIEFDLCVGAPSEYVQKYVVWFSICGGEGFVETVLSKRIKIK